RRSCTYWPTSSSMSLRRTTSWMYSCGIILFPLLSLLLKYDRRRGPGRLSGPWSAAGTSPGAAAPSLAAPVGLRGGGAAVPGFAQPRHEKDQRTHQQQDQPRGRPPQAVEEKGRRPARQRQQQQAEQPD